MPYTQTNWVDGTTQGNHTNMNNLETQYVEAVSSLHGNLFTPFVLTGLGCYKDSTFANQLDIPAGTAYLTQTDGTVRERTVNNTFSTTATPSTTYYLDLNPDGTLIWGTSHSGNANHLTICTVTTDGSGNILTITDTRVLTTSLLLAASGPINIPAGLTGTTVPQIGTTNAGSTANPQVKAATNTGISVEETTGNGKTLAAIIPTNNNNGTVRGIGLGYTDAAGTFHLILQSDDGNALTYTPTNAHFRAASFFSGTGSGTVSHGFPSTPSWVGITDSQSASTMTVGVDTIGSSTCGVNCGASHTWRGMATG